MDYKIRFATPDDHDLIYALKVESVRPYVERIWGWDEDYQRKDFDTDFAHIKQFNVIEVDGKFAGFVQYYFEYPYFEVVEIHLLPEYRGKGIGSDILRYLKKVCIAQDRKIRIGCFKENHRAKHLYQRLGFVQTEETDTHFILEYPNYTVMGNDGGYMDKNNRNKLLLFDLDDTLLRSDKTISERTLEALRKCREQGILIGISTSRAVHNCMTFLPELTPDLFIASGGAVIQYHGENIYTAEFTVEETQQMIRTAREICGADCEITIDTLDAHYWNYKVDPKETDATWGDTIYTDFSAYTERALKFCVEVFDTSAAKRLADCLSNCDCHKFAGTEWYKFTKKEATKENAILKACEICGIALENVTAFGDDSPDIGMLKLCGTGVAMGNAIDTVKEAADVVIGSNDEDGIAKYLEQRSKSFD